MKKIKVLAVFGTRPEAIKMAPLVCELYRREKFETVVCVTAQHRSMLDQVLDVFKIKPDYDLDIMRHDQTLEDISYAVLSGVGDVIGSVNPDIVLVHGDTTTAFASALAAFYCKTLIGHVEAGLRSYNKYSPFPEEMNRVLISSLADFHFAPTVANMENLLKENVCADNIFVTGNTVVDALGFTVKDDYLFCDEKLRQVDFSRRVILLTAHRRENFGQHMENICRAVLHITEQFPDVTVVCPVHLNPNVKDVVTRILGGNDKIILTEPLAPLELHNLMARCFMVLTDSGGLQEEAPSLNKPVVVLRRETERAEALEAGCVVLAGTSFDKIVETAEKFLTDKQFYDKVSAAENPYGSGRASSAIADVLQKKLPANF